MERSSKPADLKLVSKYYPVANYSYPRSDMHHHHLSPSPPHQCRVGHTDRSSFGSEGSAPGLVDDDSEVSADDDYQYHAHAAELWDSFWQQPASSKEKTKAATLELHPAKQYPALIPSPRRTQKQHRRDVQKPAWPLPETPKPRDRKPAATYSPFPKLNPPLPPRTSSLVPAWQPARPVGKPVRPPRPASSQLPPQIEEEAPMTAHFITPPDVPPRLSNSRPVTPITPSVASSSFTPITPSTPCSPRRRPATSMSARPSTRVEARLSIRSVISHSNLTASTRTSGTVGPSRGLHKPASLCHIRPQRELHSVFEYDESDSEREERHGRSFFRFHKRSDSDPRRTWRSPERRDRANTLPASPTKDRTSKLQQQDHHNLHDARKRQADVLGRMLGRRSR